MLRVFHKETGVRVVFDNAPGIIGSSPATIVLAPGCSYTLKVATNAVPAIVSILDSGGSRVWGPESIDANSIKTMAVVSFPNTPEQECFQLIVSITPMKKVTVVRRASEVASDSSPKRKYVSAPDFSEPLSSSDWSSSGSKTSLMPIMFAKMISTVEV